MENYMNRFRLDNRVIVITGAAGFLGIMHVKAVLEAGGIPVLIDIDQGKMDEVLAKLKREYPEKVILGYVANITNKRSLERIRDDVLSKIDHIDGLINNACNNPKMKDTQKGLGRLEMLSHSSPAVGSY